LLQLPLCFNEMGFDPFEDFGEPELPFSDRIDHEVVSRERIDFQVELIDEEKGVGGSEGDTFVAVQERIVVCQGLI
jgi:hypothetical protein